MRHKIKIALKSAVNPKYGMTLARLYRVRKQINAEREKSYIEWFEYQKLSEEQLEEQRTAAANLANRPLVSILLPTYNTNPEYLTRCIESVLAQTYDNWELCISDDASPSAETRRTIKRFEKKYDNIRATFNKTNGHISASSNVALKMAKGEFISLLDHDDILPPNALYEAVKVINEQPDIDLIYTDEDKIDSEGNHIEPFFKPDWSPNFLNSCNVITHFATIRAEVMREIGGFTIGTHGAQDWDLFLRITQQTQKVYHIPKILYHWRKSETSTAMNADSKPYAYINQKRVLRESVIARRENAYIEEHAALGFWRKRYVIEQTPLVSIIIPTKDNYKLIKRCIDSIIEKTTYPYFEIVVVDTGSTDKQVKAYYAKLAKEKQPVNVVSLVEKPFNFSKACNYGAKKAKGEYLLFLNNDTEVITLEWIQAMLEHAQRENIGMVGAKLLFPNEEVQHAGIVLSERDIAFHPFYMRNPLLDIFSYIFISNIREVSAVTAACSMVSRAKFEEVGGFDVKLRVTYNDVDLNLKLRKAGYTNLYTPYAELFHHESVSVGRVNTDSRDQLELKSAQDLMRKRWKKYLQRDPFYNDNFEQFGPGYRLPKQ